MESSSKKSIWKNKNVWKPIAWILLASLTLIITSCQVIQENNSVDQIEIYLPEEPTDTPPATPEISKSPFLTWIDPAFPELIQEQINAYNTLIITEDKSQALVRITADSGQFLGSIVYLAVVPFYSFYDEISSSEILSIWKAEDDLDYFYKIYLTEGTKTALALIWGETNSDRVKVVAINELENSVRGDHGSLAIIPFEDISIDWKVLLIDGNDPLSSLFDNSVYFLTIPIKVETTDLSLASLELSTGISNYDPEKLSSIALTGVTALVRDTAYLMEENGITYPAENIRNILENASITHISNEVPFAEDCPSPDPNQISLYFCSKDSYIELLEEVGTDIVELSGDHLSDWGDEAIKHTLDLYHDRGWLTYGGGETLQIGLEPVFIEHNGNSFAFIGCNGKAHDKYASATDIKPGASRCNFSWMETKIAQLKNDGYLVISTMQHEEVDSFNSIAIQQNDFSRLANAGATIVSGSQAHHPQAFDYTGTAFIHYGLGNLFFDQWFLAQYNAKVHAHKDQAFIDLHFFYNGSHISTRLIAIQFIDNAQSRLMTFDEKVSFLSDVFRYSYWEGSPLIPLAP